MAYDDQQENPFAPPLSGPEEFVPLVDESVEERRRSHLSRESSIRTIGSLYFLPAVLFAVGLLATIYSIVIYGDFALGFGRSGPAETGVMLGFTAAAIGLSGFCWWLALNLRALNPSARIAGLIASLIFLVLSVLGSPNLILIVFNIMAIYNLSGEKAVYVFSSEYKEVMAATPHIRHKTSIVVWILLAILLGLIALGILAAIFAG